jgi:hypothetical protein
MLGKPFRFSDQTLRWGMDRMENRLPPDLCIPITSVGELCRMAPSKLALPSLEPDVRPLPMYALFKHSDWFRGTFSVHRDLVLLNEGLPPNDSFWQYLTSDSQ